MTMAALKPTTVEQQHATLLLKGWSRCGTRSFFKRDGGNRVVATAGNAVVTVYPEADPHWYPWESSRVYLPADLMGQVVGMIERYEAEQ